MRKSSNVLVSVRICLLTIVIVIRLYAGLIPLAPDAEAFVPLEDFFVSFSVTGYRDNIKRVKVFFDNEDISSDCRITGTTVSFIPDRTFIKRPDITGPHTVTILLYGPYRVELAKEVLRFYLYEGEDLSDDDRLTMIEKGKKLKGVTPEEFVNTGTVYTGIDYESYQDSGVFAGILDAYGSGYKGNWFYNYNMSLNTQEDEHRQTLQRFRVATGYTKSLQVSLGDNWPTYNSYILNDQCVRGVEVNLKTPKGSANLDFAFGMAKRAIDPFIYDMDGLTAAIDSSTSGTITHNDSITFYEDGTYKRKILATRLHFGTGRIFKLGIDFLKAKDDSSSIHQIYTTDTGGTVTIIGETPKDNIVAGADICFNFWKRRITLYSHGALSLFTNNILGGAATEEEISEVAGKDVSLVTRPKDIEKLFIVNETTVPLPIPSDPDERVNMGSLKNASAWDVGFRVNLPLADFHEMFELKYFFAGPNYTSLGNPNYASSGKEYSSGSVNKAGIQFIEELKLFNGKIYLKGDFKYYKDDLHNVKTNPTRKVTFNCLATVMWNSKIPYITFMVISNDEVTQTSKDAVIPPRDNAFNQIGTTIQYARDFKRTSHTFSLTYTYNNYDSKIYFNSVINRFSLRGNNAVFTLISSFDDLPIQTRGGLSGFLSKGDYSVNRIAPFAGVTWNILPNKMAANADISFEHMNDEAYKAVNYWTAKSSFSYDISRTHSLYAEAGLDRKVGAGYIDRNALVTYEFRY